MKIKDQALSQADIDRLDPRMALKVNSVNVGSNGIFTDTDENQDQEFKLSDLLDDTASVAQYVQFCDDLGKERRIEITHRFRPPTAADAIAYERNIQDGEP